MELMDAEGKAADEGVRTPLDHARNVIAQVDADDQFAAVRRQPDHVVRSDRPRGCIVAPPANE